MKEADRSLGNDPGPLAPPPAAHAPEKVKISDVEIYYSAGRSVTVVTSSFFDINLLEGEGSPLECARRADCSLRELKTKFLYVRHGTGICEVDLLKGRYVSKNCPWTESAPGVRGESSKKTSRATGERRQIAGQECEVFDLANGTLERCFALPPSSFPIPVSHHSGRRPGLLLQQKWLPMGETLTAKEVRLEMDVSAAIFDPPPGVRLEGAQRDRKRK